MDEKEVSLHSEKDIGDYLASIANDVIPLSTPQWRMYIYENFSETESAILFKEHHCLADGVGILEIILLMTDEFRPEAIIDFRPTTWVRQMMLYAISPLFILYYMIPILCKSRDKFSITNPDLSGEKVYAVGSRFPLEDIKRSAKDLGVSLNDLCAASLSRGLTEYLREMGDDRVGTLTSMIPVNLRTTKMTRPSDVKLQNNFIIVLVKFCIGESLGNEIKRINKIMKKAKNSLMPIAIMYIQQLIIRFVPIFISRPLMDYTASK